MNLLPASEIPHQLQEDQGSEGGQRRESAGKGDRRDSKGEGEGKWQPKKKDFAQHRE
jgi:hypothetical protein